MDNLSTFERDVLCAYLRNPSPSVIAKALKRPRRSIDDALQRIKGKIRPGALVTTTTDADAPAAV